jgi:type IX secretion system PorP/SprF family membrane protein
MKRTVFFIVFLGNFIHNIWAIDPQFTQFYSAPLYLSPSFAGATQQNRISSIYRQQWTSIPGAFVTYSLGYDHYFSNYNSGVGIMLMRDQAGSGKLGYNYINLLYSYDFVFLYSWHVRPGVSFIYKTFSLDFTKLKFYDQLTDNGPSAVQAPSAEIRGHIDGSASVLFYNSDIWTGFSLDHLLKPNESFFGDNVPTPLKYTFYGGVRLIKKGRLLKPLDESISIAYLLKFQGDYSQLDIGLYWYKSPLVFGLWYRGIPALNKQFGDAISVLLGLKTNQLTFGYSYDFTISNLINSTGGSHEVSLIYEFQTKFKKKYHAIPCPEF